MQCSGMLFGSSQSSLLNGMIDLTYPPQCMKGVMPHSLSIAMIHLDFNTRGDDCFQPFKGSNLLPGQPSTDEPNLQESLERLQKSLGSHSVKLWNLGVRNEEDVLLGLLWNTMISQISKFRKSQQG